MTHHTHDPIPDGGAGAGRRCPNGDSYIAFLAGKQQCASAIGFESDLAAMCGHLFDWQRLIVRWALWQGRAAIFATTGMGKTRLQTVWADRVQRHTGGNVLILAPLAVAQQTIREGAQIGVTVRYCRAQHDVQPGITISNYDILERFDLDQWAGIVLDESSIIKSHDSRTRVALTEGARCIPYRLACTATPAPNDYMELGTQAEFLGVMTQAEMLATYFVHDGGSTQDWRLKRHAVADFWRWVASWSVLLRLPSEIGGSDTGYLLPPLQTEIHTVAAADEWLRAQGYLVAPSALSLSQARTARRASMPARVAACAELVNGTPGQWLVWCALNEESHALAAAIPDATEVVGSDSRETKEAALLAFADGRIRVLVSKPAIAGVGMNFQRCHQIAFVGVDYSWEGYFQAVRRCWRFGQEHPVVVHLFLSDAERGVLEALQDKERAADAMYAEITGYMAPAMRGNLQRDIRQLRGGYDPRIAMRLPVWLGDANACA